MRSRLAWFVAVAVVAGCRTLPVQQPTPGGAAAQWGVTRPALQARDHFELKGRVAVAAGKEGFSATLRWTQEGARSRVSLEGPLGAGGVLISADGNNLSIINSHGDHLDNDAAHADLEARLGFDPPLSSLRYWILGVPDPGMPAKESLDSLGQRLQRLEQGGWEIEYAGYMPGGPGPAGAGAGGAAVGPGGAGAGGAGAGGAGGAGTGGDASSGAGSASPGAWLPAKMTVQRSGVRVRVVIDGWGS